MNAALRAAFLTRQTPGRRELANDDMRSFVSDGSVFYRGNRRMMRSRLRAYVALAFVAMLAACGGPVNTVPVAQPAPSASPTPTASPSPGPLSVTPTTLSFTAAGLVQNLTVGDPSYTGAFTISGCSGIVTAGAVASGSLSVTSVAGGSCTLTISDTFSHQVTVSVSVNTLSVPVI
jgi:predicted small lipoprotein YifL